MNQSPEPEPPTDVVPVVEPLRIQLMSDLHVEFDRDGGDAMAASIEPKGDVIVLAGDIGMGEAYRNFMHQLADRLAPMPIVVIPGNHEYYASNFAATDLVIEDLCGLHSNLVNLQRRIWTFKGRRFLGCTLWYRDPGQYNWSDYRHIKDAAVGIEREATASANFLRDNLQQGDIVVTHMLPSERAVAPRYRNNDLNRYFVLDLTSLIIERAPALWMFGHTHDRITTRIGETDLVCRPRGYPFEQETTQYFNPNEIITLP